MSCAHRKYSSFLCYSRTIAGSVHRKNVLYNTKLERDRDMQYHLNGYTFGDPSIAPAAPNHRQPGDDLPEQVDVLVVGTGPAGAVLTA